jgi:hypothetical protein
VQHDVLDGVELRIEPGTQLDEWGDATANDNATTGRWQDSRQHLQERRLSAAVGAHDGEDLSAPDAHGQRAQCPELARSTTASSADVAQRVAHRTGPKAILPVGDTEIVDPDGGVRRDHRATARRAERP